MLFIDNEIVNFILVMNYICIDIYNSPIQLTRRNAEMQRLE